MGGKSGASGRELEDALAKQLVVDEFVKAATDSTARDSLEWLQPQPTVRMERRGDAKDVDFICSTASGARWWLEAKRGRGVGKEVEEDLRWMMRGFLDRRERGLETEGDRYELVIDSDRGPSTWNDLEEALRLAREGADDWAEWTTAGDSREVREKVQWLRNSVSSEEGDEQAAFSFLRRLWVRRVPVPDEMRIRDLCPAVVRDRETATRLLRSIAENVAGAAYPSARVRFGELRMAFEREGIVVAPSLRVARALERLREEDARESTRRGLHPAHPEWRIGRTQHLDSLAALSTAGPVAVVGEAGSGKSQILCDLVEGLGKDATLLLPARIFRIESRGELRQSLLEGCPASEVFAGWTEGGPRLLAVDGLDEVEGNDVHDRLREVVSAALDAGVRVVVAARTPDAERFERDLLRAFARYSLPKEFSGGELENVRALRGCPNLAGLQKRPALKVLARSPFRMGLLVELLVERGWTGLDEIGSETALLDAYWDLRVRPWEGLDLEATAYDVAVQIVEHGTDAVGKGVANASCLEKLCSAGILLAGRDEVRFPSRILRDYAFARALAQGRVDKEPLEWLAEHREELTSVSVVRAWLHRRLARARQEECEPEAFWRELADLLAEPRLRPAHRHEAVAAVAQALRPGDVEALWEKLTDADQVDLFGRLLKERCDRIRDTGAPEEADLLVAGRASSCLGTPAETQATRLFELLAKHLPEDARGGLVDPFLRAWERASVGPQLGSAMRLVDVGAGLAAAMGEQLTAWVAHAREQSPWIGTQLLARLPDLASTDADLAVDTYERLAVERAHEEGPEESFYTGTWYREGVVRDLLDRAPERMTRAVCRLVSFLAAWENAQLPAPWKGRARGKRSTIGPGSALLCREDGSWSWAEDLAESGHVDLQDLKELQDAWIAWAKEGSRLQALETSLVSFSEEAVDAVLWSRFLGSTLAVLEDAPDDEGRVPTDAARELFSRLALRFLEKADWRDCESVRTEAVEVAGVLGAQWALTEALPGPGRRIEVAMGSPSRRELDAAQGIDGAKPGYAGISEARQNLEAAQRSFEKREASSKDVVVHAIELLEVLGSSPDLDPVHRTVALQQMGAAAVCLLERWKLVDSDEHRVWAETVALALADSPDPDPDVGTDTVPMGASRAARVSSATGLCVLAHHRELVEKERRTLFELSRDASAEVRVAIAQHLQYLVKHEAELAWSIAEDMARREHGAAGGTIVRWLVAVLRRCRFFWQRDAARAAAILGECWGRRPELATPRSHQFASEGLEDDVCRLMTVLAVVTDEEDATSFVHEQLASGTMDSARWIASEAARILVSEAPTVIGRATSLLVSTLDAAHRALRQKPPEHSGHGRPVDDATLVVSVVLRELRRIPGHAAEAALLLSVVQAIAPEPAPEWLFPHQMVADIARLAGRLVGHREIEAAVRLLSFALYREGRITAAHSHPTVERHAVSALRDLFATSGSGYLDRSVRTRAEAVLQDFMAAGSPAARDLYEVLVEREA